MNIKGLPLRAHPTTPEQHDDLRAKTRASLERIRLAQQLAERRHWERTTRPPRLPRYLRPST